MSDTEPTAAEWRVFLERHWDELIKGMPKRQDGGWKELPACPVLAHFELFPVVKLQ